MQAEAKAASAAAAAQVAANQVGQLGGGLGWSGATTEGFSASFNVTMLLLPQDFGPCATLSTAAVWRLTEAATTGGPPQLDFCGIGALNLMGMHDSPRGHAIFGSLCWELDLQLPILRLVGASGGPCGACKVFVFDTWQQGVAYVVCQGELCHAAMALRYSHIYEYLIGVARRSLQQVDVGYLAR